METNRLNVAVIGGGVAGVVSAHILQQKHDVTLFEAGSYLGGHTNTVEIDEGPDAGTFVDTGFIVLNDQTYPNLHKFLAQLGVSVRYSDMSFGYQCSKSGFEYAGTSINGLFAKRKNLLSPRFYRMMFDISRFGKTAVSDLDNGLLSNQTLKDYVFERGFSEPFIDDYLIPMAASIWSSPKEEILGFPIEALVKFFKNHGLLSLKDRPLWQTVSGGSISYIKAFKQQFKGKILLKHYVNEVKRHPDGATVLYNGGESRRFDKVVIALHADKALSVLSDPSEEETKALSPWEYKENHTVLHYDDSVLPKTKRSWASWNYRRQSGNGRDSSVAVTYHMNRLQGLNSERNYCVTLNSIKNINEKKIVGEFVYDHPVFSLQSLRTQKILPDLNGQRNSYFCGSYFGFGFHEDAVQSAVNVGKTLSLEL